MHYLIHAYQDTNASNATQALNTGIEYATRWAMSADGQADHDDSVAYYGHVDIGEGLRHDSIDTGITVTVSDLDHVSIYGQCEC